MTTKPQKLNKSGSLKKNPYSLRCALGKGGPMVWLSCLIMGLGNVLAGQVIKGILFFLVEAALVVFLFLPEGGLHWLSMLPSLGWLGQGKVFDEELGVYIYTQGHQSQLILLYGVATVVAIAFVLVIWYYSVTNGYKVLCFKKEGKHVPTFREDMASLLDKNVHITLMSPPLICLMIFTVVPLIYMMCMAFTNYSKIGDHLVLFDWVGLDNFKAMLNAGSSIGREFWGVLGWTIVWAFFATFLNFFLGTIVAMIINRKGTRLKGLWRGCLCVTIAIPQFVSLLVMRSMLQPQGIINQMLMDWGWIDQALPFFTNTTWARVTVIIINLWVGIPYTIMQVTGILKNIPAEQYEAARIDGANPIQEFINVTLPYMIFVMTPYIITQFTGNINNFNVIYLLSGGAPQSIENTAGSTDLLVTWLYKLSVDQQKYNLAAVIGIMTFVVLSVVSLITYRSSKSYKEEEGFK